MLNNGFWKEAAKYLGTALVTGAGAWLVFAANTPTKADVIQTVDTKIEARVGPIEDKLEPLCDIPDQVNNLSTRMSALEAQRREDREAQDADMGEIKTLISNNTHEIMEVLRDSRR